MSPSHRLPEERENQILRAAVAVFAERGFASARMDDIVQESGLSKGTLFVLVLQKQRCLNPCASQTRPPPALPSMRF